MSYEKIIPFDSPEAATYRTALKGWVSSHGHFFGDRPDSERMSRYDGCTHVKCRDCDNLARKGWLVCGECLAKMRSAEYNALPFKPYDGSPSFLWDNGIYFSNEDDILFYIDDMDEEDRPEELHLVFCDENKYRTVPTDYWSDNEPEDSDGELPEEMQNALNKLNEIIIRMPAQSYRPGKVRTTYIIEKD